LNVHASRRWIASTAEQLTLVVPTANADALAGMHVVDTGAWPPDTDGAGNVTAVGCPSGEIALAGAGHEITGAVVVGPVGVSLPHDALKRPARMAPVTSPARRRIERE
jgi:hypothetical protein